MTRNCRLKTIEQRFESRKIDGTRLRTDDLLCKDYFPISDRPYGAEPGVRNVTGALQETAASI